MTSKVNMSAQRLLIDDKKESLMKILGMTGDELLDFCLLSHEAKSEMAHGATGTISVEDAASMLMTVPDRVEYMVRNGMIPGSFVKAGEVFIPAWSGLKAALCG